MKKAGSILKKIYGYGITACLFLSGATVFAYIAALFIGGDTATEICTFTYKVILHDLIIAGSGVVLLGLVAMYLCGESAMKIGKTKKE